MCIAFFCCLLVCLFSLEWHALTFYHVTDYAALQSFIAGVLHVSEASWPTVAEVEVAQLVIHTIVADKPFC